MKNFMINTTTCAKNSIQKFKNKTTLALKNNKGDQNVGQAISVLIAVVIGALLLAGLYTLFDDVVMPTVTTKVEEMFDYNG